MFYYLDKIIGFGVSGFVLYYYRNRIPYILNDCYINMIKTKKLLLDNKGFSKCTQIDKIDDLSLYQYKYNEDVYYLLGKANDVIYPPYSDEMLHTSKGESTQYG